MNSKQPVKEPSSAWITIAGILLALLLCLIATSMVFIAFPQSTSLINLMLIQGTQVIPLDEDVLAQAEQATPFQPLPLPTATPSPEPTATKEVAAPTKVSNDSGEISAEIPAYAYINGFYGSPQLYTLDCEAQSAVDFARFFDVSIDENEFIDKLPKSDDPESGFVGEVDGEMGQFPPDDYGVHAAPVAKLLRAYGVPAKTKRDWSLEDIKEEIAAGQPVIVWIVNLPYAIDTMQYTASNGNTTTVARYEHTWIITGYNSTTITVVDSQWTYNVKIATFMERWEALGQQAIIYRTD